MGISRVLSVNRGEIAARVVHAAQALGIEAVQAVSAADRESRAAQLADRTVVIGPAPSRQSYLDAKLLVHTAVQTGCDALHPGYGFLSERAELARLCAEHGITFIGPAPETIAALGDKLEAKALARAAGVPLVPGTDRIDSAEEAAGHARELGFPVLCKAAAGGGGRGMFIARSAADLLAGFDKASNEACEAFGDGTMYMERYVENARHVEVQVFGDGEGKVLHFGERDCSIQRRYQKVVEESPCAAMPDGLRAELHRAATALVASVKYRNAGTVEFLYDVERQAVYFIEVNARIQVEHPVSEQVTGVDLVKLQFRVAAGEGLALEQSQIAVRGHAIECRLNAEDPTRNFQPSPGRITRWDAPHGAGVRFDTHCYDGYLVPPFYDSMLGKLVVTGPNREAAVDRLEHALAHLHVAGPVTNLALLRYIAAHPDFRANRLNTRWLEQTLLPAFAEDSKE
ncbi:MAG: ATP-grasp domain-containing protein [Gammaproteobacteria bacterium]|nr:ATP-grasp domain-containing protein [Gammaproteobacteria bacterium]